MKIILIVIIVNIVTIVTIAIIMIATIVIIVIATAKKSLPLSLLENTPGQLLLLHLPGRFNSSF